MSWQIGGSGFFALSTIIVVSSCSAVDVLDSLEQEIKDIELRLVHKTQEYIVHAQQLHDFRKRRYQELCRKKLAQLIVTLQQKGIHPAKVPNTYHLSAPLTSAEGYLVAIVDPQEAFEKQIGEAASSWSSNPFLGTESPCIFIMLPQAGCGNTLATRYLSYKGELGPLLAHEIGHLWKFHDHEIGRYINRWNTYMYLTAGGAVGALIAALVAYSKNETSQEHDNRLKNITAAVIAGGAIIAGSMGLLYAKIKQFSRRQELEADQFVAALGETGIQQFVMTLVRWHLDDRLHAFLEPSTWFHRQLAYIKKTTTYIKKRFSGTHPSHEKRLFHLIVAWRTMKMRDLSDAHSCPNLGECQVKNDIVSTFLAVLDRIPELQPKNILTTLAVNFPHKSVTAKEHAALERLLLEIRQELIAIIDKALDAPL